MLTQGLTQLKIRPIVNYKCKKFYRNDTSLSGEEAINVIILVARRALVTTRQKPEQHHVADATGGWRAWLAKFGLVEGGYERT